MELTRRDALVALAASGVTVGAGTALSWETFRDDSRTSGDGDAAGAEGSGDRGGRSTASDQADSDAEDSESVAFTERERETLVALARTLYPSAVTGVPDFTEIYVVGRVRNRPAYAEGIKAALETLEEYATEWFDGEYRALSSADRDALLRQMGLASAAPDPAGSDPERLRYYLVNELLYALYSSPTGGKLVGIENPPGHPGGIESYRCDPPSER
jgi:hypothetical protein